MKKALIFGVTGQDGSYLADLLTEKGYEVHGTYRRTSVDNTLRIKEHVRSGALRLHQVDLLDSGSIARVLLEAQPHEIYNEADQDDANWSKNLVGSACDLTAGAVGKLLELIERCCPTAKVFQPLSALMFGDVPGPQNELSCFRPLSPYAVGKVAAYYWCRYFRRRGLSVSTGILYNHDSPRRSENYLFHRIVKTALRSQPLRVWSPDELLDVGYARDYMEAAWRMLQRTDADDYVIGGGVRASPRFIFETACALMGYETPAVVEVPRPAGEPVTHLQSDITKAQIVLDWRPTTHLHELILLVSGAKQ